MSISDIAAWITITVFAWNIIYWVWKKIRIHVFVFLKVIISYIVRFFQHVHRWLENRNC